MVIEVRDSVPGMNMETYNTYQNETMTESEFQKLAQNIGTNIQKILQNGKKIRDGYLCLLETERKLETN